MDEWCLICHKVTSFQPVEPRMAGIRGRRQAIPGLWCCAECHMVVFREEPITEEEKKAARERAELLEGFD